MLFPAVSCTTDGTVCQVTVGEGEINAAASMMALVLCDAFDLRSTYLFLGGIAGVNPRHGTLGSVAIARYAVQVALQYEIDPRSLPEGSSTGYIGYGRAKPDQYPTISYGTEVFELNANLRNIAYDLASKAKLADSNTAKIYRARYQESFEKAAKPPSVIKCDVATSDVYYSGTMLAEAFESTTRLWTNGTGASCMSAQEDSAILEVLVRGAIEKLVDFSRVMVIRTGR
jgi:purine nucleoside permease